VLALTTLNGVDGQLPTIIAIPPTHLRLHPDSGQRMESYKHMPILDRVRRSCKCVISCACLTQICDQFQKARLNVSKLMQREEGSALFGWSLHADPLGVETLKPADGLKLKGIAAAAGKPYATGNPPLHEGNTDRPKRTRAKPVTAVIPYTAKQPYQRKPAAPKRKQSSAPGGRNAKDDVVDLVSLDLTDGDTEDEDEASSPYGKRTKRGGGDNGVTNARATAGKAAAKGAAQHKPPKARAPDSAARREVAFAHAAMEQMREPLADVAAVPTQRTCETTLAPPPAPTPVQQRAPQQVTPPLPPPEHASAHAAAPWLHPSNAQVIVATSQLMTAVLNNRAIENDTSGAATQRAFSFAQGLLTGNFGQR